MDNGTVLGIEGETMLQISLENAQARLPQLLHDLPVGTQCTITENGEPLALITHPPQRQWPCQPGTARDRTSWMAADFDAPLEDFSEFMQ